MKMKQIGSQFIFALIFSCLLCSDSLKPAAATQPQKPNIIVILGSGSFTRLNSHLV